MRAADASTPTPTLTDPLPRLRGRSEINPAAKSFDGLYRPARKHVSRSMES